MTCPFLKEAQVQYCQTAAIRTMIPLERLASVQEICSSDAHAGCPVYQGQPQQADDSGVCPHLRETLMQYCAAAPVTKFIPYSESLLSRCGNDSHRYCELYLGMARPGTETELSDDLPAPGRLLYSANHMWLDVSDGVCHAGIDAFLSRALGKIDAITYVCLKGRQRPAAVLTASGLDYQVAFPNPFQVTACNLYLRANPARVTAQPYTGGWLFEGIPQPETSAHLLSGAAVKEWMHGEVRRMSEYLQQYAGVTADGGLFVPDLAAHLDRDQMLDLFHEFFSREASETRQA